MITSPKTPKSNRVVTIPVLLVNCLREYMEKWYGLEQDDRIFPYTKNIVNHVMARACEEVGVKKIRVHDIRHSHVSALSDMGIQDAAIANRVGHASIQMTRHYTHVYAAAQQMMANMLNQKMEERYVTEKP